MERWRAWKFRVEELQSFSAFVRLKYDTTEMTAAINDYCIG